MVKPYLNPVGGKVDNDVSTFDGGLNTYVDKAFLESNQMPYVMNMTMKKPPAIETRDSRSSMAEFLVTQGYPYPSGKILNMWAYNQTLIYFLWLDEDQDIVHLMFFKQNGPNGKYNQYDIDSFSNTQDKIYFCYCRTQTTEYLYYGNESMKRRTILGDTTAVVDTYNDHFGIPVWHKGRLFLAKPSTDTVEWSNALKPDDFTIGYTQDPPVAGDSGELYINNMRGSLVGIASFDDKLMVFCEHSVHAIYGNSGVATEADYFQVVDILGNIGCQNQSHIAVSGGSLFFVGDDKQVYEFTGSTIHMISRPAKTRNSTLSIGGVDNLLNGLKITNLAANSNKLYIDTEDGYMFVFDTHNRIWWCEDGGFSSICNYSQAENNLLMATNEGDILTYDIWNGSTGRDYVYSWETNKVISKSIDFEFHTRVYGADGADLRKTISDVWLQCWCTNGAGSVYITDAWNAREAWRNKEAAEERYKKIGTFQPNGGMGSLDYYYPTSYEQRHFVVEKMFGQRLNAFQVIVQGSLYAKFYLMKREWRAR